MQNFNNLRLLENTLNKIALKKYLDFEEQHNSRLKCIKRLRIFLKLKIGNGVRLRIDGRVINDYRNVVETRMSELLKRVVVVFDDSEDSKYLDQFVFVNENDDEIMSNLDELDKDEDIDKAEIQRNESQEQQNNFQYNGINKMENDESGKYEEQQIKNVNLENETDEIKKQNESHKTNENKQMHDDKNEMDYKIIKTTNENKEIDDQLKKEQLHRETNQNLNLHKNSVNSENYVKTNEKYCIAKDKKRFCVSGNAESIFEWHNEGDKIDAFELVSDKIPKSIKILLEFDNSKDLVRLSASLKKILLIDTTTKTKAIIEFWKYLRTHKLIGNDGFIVINDLLQNIFSEKVHIDNLLTEIEKHFLPLEILSFKVPISNYERIFDVKMERDDLTDFPVLYKNKSLGGLEKKIQYVLECIERSNDKIEALDRFGNDPNSFVNHHISHECKDLDFLGISDKGIFADPKILENLYEMLKRQ